jgi:lycopene beta-cyclase
MKSVLKPPARSVDTFVSSLQHFKLSWWKVCLGLWVLSMIPTPLFPDYFLILSYLSTLLLSTAIFGYALEKYGPKTYMLFMVTFTFGIAVEYLGETTGFPFGHYRYTALGPSIFGVPLMVPLGWWAFTMIALSISSNYKYWLAPLALVAWDVGLDPLMVKQGFWIFSEGFYYGIPLSNFVGWFAAGCVLVRLLVWLEPRLYQDSSPVLRFVFGVQAFLMGVGLTVFYAMPLAGLMTALMMGLCLLITRKSV